MTAEALDLDAAEYLMVVAHNEDLHAAARCGLRTAFVARPLEHGIGQKQDLAPEGCYDYVAKDFCDLATQLGCP